MGKIKIEEKKKVKTLRPANRHLVVVPHIKKNETNGGVLLPEGYKQEEDRYICATVVSVSPDCSEHIRRVHFGSSTAGSLIIIDRNMLEEVRYENKIFNLILENYVIGFIRGLDEN